jgi:hypothetical protein
VEKTSGFTQAKYNDKVREEDPLDDFPKEAKLIPCGAGKAVNYEVLLE